MLDKIFEKCTVRKKKLIEENEFYIKYRISLE